MINYISKPFRWFFKLESSSGLVLLFAAIIALIECFFMKNTVNNYNYKLAQDIFKEIEVLRK